MGNNFCHGPKQRFDYLEQDGEEVLVWYVLPEDWKVPLKYGMTRLDLGDLWGEPKAKIRLMTFAEAELRKDLYFLSGSLRKEVPDPTHGIVFFDPKGYRRPL